MSATTFADNLRAAILAKPTLHVSDHRILNVLNRPESAHKERVLERLERHVALHLGLPAGEAGQIDWSLIDWSKLLDEILTVVLAILPLLGL